MEVSPPIRFRIEWADSQGKVTASWLAAHFNFGARVSFPAVRSPSCMRAHSPFRRRQKIDFLLTVA